MLTKLFFYRRMVVYIRSIALLRKPKSHSSFLVSNADLSSVWLCVAPRHRHLQNQHPFLVRGDLDDDEEWRAAGNKKGKDRGSRTIGVWLYQVGDFWQWHSFRFLCPILGRLSSSHPRPVLSLYVLSDCWWDANGAGWSDSTCCFRVAHVCIFPPIPPKLYGFLELVLSVTSTFCSFHPLLVFYFHFFLAAVLPLLKSFLFINFVWLPLLAFFMRARGISNSFLKSVIQGTHPLLDWVKFFDQKALSSIGFC